MEKQIISYTDFKLLPTEKKKEIFKELNNTYSTKEIQDAWGVESRVIYGMRYSYITKEKGGSSTKSSKSKAITSKKKTEKSFKTNVENKMSNSLELQVEENDQQSFMLQQYQNLQAENDELKNRLQEQEKQQQKILQLLESLQEEKSLAEEKEKQMTTQSGFFFTFKGEFSGNEVERKLEKMKLFVEGNSRYQMDVTLSEVEQSVIESEPKDENQDEKKNPII